MEFDLLYTDEALYNLQQLNSSPSYNKRLKSVQKALKYLSHNPRHPSLNTHKYELLSRELGIEVFEAYAENKTPGAYRIFWHYGKKCTIVIVAITPHP